MCYFLSSHFEKMLFLSKVNLMKLRFKGGSQEPKSKQQYHKYIQTDCFKSFLLSSLASLGFIFSPQNPNCI
jgi:hypothetical protein